MSNLKLLSSEGALKRQMDMIKKRKGKKVANVLAPQIVKPTEKVAFIEPSNPLTKKSKKHSRPDEEGLDEGLVIKFPSNMSLYLDLSSMVKQAEQLLFPKDEARLTKIEASQAVNWGLTSAYQSFQTQLFLRKDVRSLTKKVTYLTSSNAKMKKKLEEARSTETRANEAMKEAVNKLASLEEENARLRASLKSSEDKLSQIDDNLADTLERLDI
ncbi:hypothetical protein Q3G72_020456 [Acer saccharum]|nr:hypothetical protein Q3G72_020456 [Acer saccharum]